MKRLIRSLYLNKRLFAILIILAVLFLFSFFVPNLFGTLKLLFYALLILVCFDAFLLYQNRKGMQASRLLPDKLSNGDENDITIRIQNTYRFKASIKIIDELPIQWQRRDFRIFSILEPSRKKHSIIKCGPRNVENTTLGI